MAGILLGLLTVGIGTGLAAAFSNNYKTLIFPQTTTIATGYIEVYELDGTKVNGAHYWGTFTKYESKNWTVQVKNLGNDISYVIWQPSEWTSENWKLEAFQGETLAEAYNVYHADSKMVLEPQKSFFIMFVLSRNGASTTVEFNISILDVA